MVLTVVVVVVLLSVTVLVLGHTVVVGVGVGGRCFLVVLSALLNSLVSTIPYTLRKNEKWR